MRLVPNLWSSSLARGATDCLQLGLITRALWHLPTLDHLSTQGWPVEFWVATHYIENAPRISVAF